MHVSELKQNFQALGRREAAIVLARRLFGFLVGS